MKYPISPKIAPILLASVRDGVLNLRDLSPSAADVPGLFYAECITFDGGRCQWMVHHLPIVDGYVWNRYCSATYRAPSIILTKDEKSAIIQACMRNEADSDALARIFPIDRKPVIAGIIYSGFDKCDSRPSVPDWIVNGYCTLIHPRDSDFGICASFADNDCRAHAINNHQIDLSNGAAIDASKAAMYDMLCTGLIFYS